LHFAFLRKASQIQGNVHLNLVRVDLHVHSSASADCRSDPEQVVRRCRQLGLSPVFFTDHDTIDGAAGLGATGIDAIVIGEEVLTSEGEIIGLFLERPIRPGLSVKETTVQIKAQGGLIYLEHPYDSTRRHLSEDAIESIGDLIDIVEVFNGRSDDVANRRAEDLCEILGAAPGAGSDAHTLGEIGGVYVEMEAFGAAQDFLVKLRGAKIVKHRRKLLLLAEARLRNNRRT
jgi:predicted metal-dependent phosphoesterase TrpH